MVSMMDAYVKSGKHIGYRLGKTSFHIHDSTKIYCHSLENGDRARGHESTPGQKKPRELTNTSCRPLSTTKSVLSSTLSPSYSQDLLRDDAVAVAVYSEMEP